MPADLTPYLRNVLAPEDRPLLEEASLSAEAGALRGAYVLTWLSCAESLKRRFREAQNRDGKAGRVVGEIERREKEHRAVDRFVLEAAKDYGFVSETAYTELLHIYEMRCVYGHPYKVAPLEEQVTSAAAQVVKHVLSQPVKLRHGYAEGILASMYGDRHYLDDHAETVQEFAVEIVNRLDEGIHAWFLSKCCASLEAMVDDPSLRLFADRGLAFVGSALDTLKGDVLSAREWHDFVQKYPKSAGAVLLSRSRFPRIGKLAQDYIVGAMLEQSTTYPSRMRLLESAKMNGLLGERQVERMEEFIRGHVLDGRSRIKIEGAVWLRSTGLGVESVFDYIIAGFRSYTWYSQNPVADMVKSAGPTAIESLTVAQQETLGRNILQSAEGCADESASLLDTIGQGEPWPCGLVRGIVTECFVNEQGQVRFKTRCLDKALACLWSLPVDDQCKVVRRIAKAVAEGKPKGALVDAKDIEKVLTKLPKRAQTGRASLASLRRAISRVEVADE